MPATRKFQRVWFEFLLNEINGSDVMEKKL